MEQLECEATNNDSSKKIFLISPTDIAEICYKANQAYREVIGQTPTLKWEEQTEEFKKGIIEAVSYYRQLDLGSTYDKAKEMHTIWYGTKVNSGWIYGEVLDYEKKTHPCMIPYEELPEADQRKDILFMSIIEALSLSKPPHLP